MFNDIIEYVVVALLLYRYSASVGVCVLVKPLGPTVITVRSGFCTVASVVQVCVPDCEPDVVISVPAIAFATVVARLYVVVPLVVLDTT